MNIQYEEQPFWDKAFLTAYDSVSKELIKDIRKVRDIDSKEDVFSVPAEYAAVCADKMVIERRKRTSHKSQEEV